ncbi:MAG: hypothetical protein DRH70_02605 [Candidatus Coatesbacteria bacterium]|nr:MAG: hypothetical protein DRH70_02605 [Candidatus Coatesbacteria bacterium]
MGAALTLCIFSFLYKDNPFYRFAEHLFVGVSAGYWLVYNYWNIVKPNLIDPLREEQWQYLLPLVLGIFMLTRLFPNVGWLSRWAIAFMIGSGSGIMIITYLQSNFLEQIKSTLVPLDPTGQPWYVVVNNVILLVGVVSGLVYFFFSKAHTGVTGRIARIGVVFLMVSFGASFGYTVMARISLLIGRLYFLLHKCVGVI